MTGRRWHALVLVLLLTAGCQTVGEDSDMTADKGKVERQGAAAKVPPENAISVGNDVFMVPVSVDADGCQQYTAWSSTKAVLAVIQYRRADGSFTPDKREAACD